MWKKELIQRSNKPPGRPDKDTAETSRRRLFRKTWRSTHWDVPGLDVCKNCGQKVTGKYCSACGQKAATVRLGFVSSIKGFFASFFNVEKGFLSTLRMLFTRPGYLSRDYIDGKRTARTNPFTVLFILATIYGILHTAMLFYLTGKPTSVDIGNTIVENVGDRKFVTILAFLAERLANSAVLLSLIMLPLYTLSIKLLLRRSNRGRYNYTELMYMGGYLASQRVIVDLIILPFKWANWGANDGYWGWVVILYVFLTAYTLRQFFGIRWVKAVWKTAMVFLLSSFFLLILVLLITGIFVGLFYLFSGHVQVDEWLHSTGTGAESLVGPDADSLKAINGEFPAETAADSLLSPGPPVTAR